MTPVEVIAFYCNRPECTETHLTYEEADKCRGDIVKIVYHKCGLCGLEYGSLAGATRCCKNKVETRSDIEKEIERRVTEFKAEITKELYGGVYESR
jgi:hypothetical protein